MQTLLDIAAGLAARRRMLGLSQRELAEQVGVSQQQIARWEATGYRAASLERVSDVAAALQVEPVDLPIAAEASAVYGLTAAPDSCAVAPVQDLGQIAVRLREATETLRDEYHFERLGVFGSFATGEQSPESDVDILVDTEDPGGLRFMNAEGFLEQILGRKVDLVRPHLLRERIRDRVLSEALYVWQP